MKRVFAKSVVAIIWVGFCWSPVFWPSTAHPIDKTKLKSFAKGFNLGIGTGGNLPMSGIDTDPGFALDQSIGWDFLKHVSGEIRFIESFNKSYQNIVIMMGTLGILIRYGRW